MAHVSVEEVFAACSLDPPTSVQLQYSNHVMESLTCAEKHSGGQVIIEAETGVGKTLGYLVPAMLKAVEKNGRVVISTYTKVLQRQVLQDAERAKVGIKAVTGKDVSIARLVGKANFFDIDRVRDVRDSIENSGATDAMLEPWDDLIEWLDSDESSGEIADWLEITGERIPGDVSQSLLCINSSSSLQAMEKYKKHALVGRTADILVTNHALLCVSALAGVHLIHSDSRQIVAVIADEADRLPDAARNMSNEQFPVVRVKSVIEKWAKRQDTLSDEVARHIVESAERFIEIANSCANGYEDTTLWESLHADDAKELTDAAVDLMGQIDGSIDAIKKSLNSIKVGEIAEDILRYRKILGKILASSAPKENGNGDKTVAFQLSPSRRFPSIGLVHLFPARILKTLWKYLEQGARGDDVGPVPEPSVTALVLTSATLSGTNSEAAGGRFWEMLNEFGIYDKVNPCGHLHRSFSPRKFGEIKRIVLSDPSVPKPFKNDMGKDEPELSEEWVAYSARMIKEAARTGGKTLALTTSYRTNAALEIALRELDVPVFVKRRLDRIDDVIARLIEAGHGVLLTPVGWEGLDARSFGFSWSNVVTCQLPIARTDSAYKTAICRYLVKRGKSESEAEGIVYGQALSSAFRRQKQAIGRGIRSPMDSFSLWIADPRVPPFGTVTESDDPLPEAVNRCMPQFSRCIPSRFQEVPTEVLLSDGRLVC
ncbi:MAG: putative ATP-dependent helicase DinG [Chloroflexota bacterium]|nr:MAG: putative ATP-dependent helicase DinG [Chloroflexota bacterium]